MKWISVKDRLPELASFVIAYKKNGLVLGLYFSADEEFRYGRDCDQTKQVTHWMPLPKPPIISNQAINDCCGECEKCLFWI